MNVGLLQTVLCSLAGGVLGSCVACVPGLHVYNLLALLIGGLTAVGRVGDTAWLLPLFAGLITGFAIANTIPAVFMAAPDESVFFAVLPAQKYLLGGRGLEATLLTTIGSGIGLGFVLMVGPFVAGGVLPVLVELFRPHWHWVLWCVISFLLLSEWPRPIGPGQAGFARWLRHWRPLAAGIVSFVLSGLLGFLLMERSPFPLTAAYQSLMPAFLGLFAVPWLLLNIVSGLPMPTQSHRHSRMDALAILHGAVAGILGGSFAALVPAVTGGVGGFLAGHATGIRDSRAFLVSQGAAKLIYYVGGFLLLFVPRTPIVRGGGATLIQSWIDPKQPHLSFMALASVALAGAASVLLVAPLAQGMCRWVGRWGYRRLSTAALTAIGMWVVAFTGWRGLVVMLTGSAIGLIPALFGSRRMNLLGVILLPMALKFSDVSSTVVHGLGLA